MTKELTDQSAVAGRDEAETTEQEADRMDDEPTTAAGTDCTRQTAEDDKDSTNRKGIHTREGDVAKAHTANPSWESTQ